MAKPDWQLHVNHRTINVRIIMPDGRTMQGMRADEGPRYRKIKTWVDDPDVRIDGQLGARDDLVRKVGPHVMIIDTRDSSRLSYRQRKHKRIVKIA